jgi:hypothetical protein
MERRSMHWEEKDADKQSLMLIAGRNILIYNKYYVTIRHYFIMWCKELPLYLQDIAKHDQIICTLSNGSIDTFNVL